MLHTQKKTTGFKHNLIHSVDGCGLWLRCRDGVEQWVEEQCQERPVGIISIGHWIRRGGGGDAGEAGKQHQQRSVQKSHSPTALCVWAPNITHSFAIQ